MLQSWQHENQEVTVHTNPSASISVYVYNSSFSLSDISLVVPVFSTVRALLNS